MIRKAENGLRKLLSNEATSEETVFETEKALRSLRQRAKNTQTLRHSLRLQNEEWKQRVYKSEQGQRTIDQQLIDTCMQRGDILMQQESLVRDLRRATQSLPDDDKEEEEDGEGGQQVVVEELRKAFSEEMSNLKMMEGQLVHVVDEMNRIKRKRTDLERKLKNVEHEW